MAKTITGTTTLGLTLTTSPTIIDGTIVTGHTPALYGSAAKTWVITNNGLLDGSLSEGILLAGGAKITNTAHATIAGGYEAIIAHAATTIHNAGTIAATSAFGAGILLEGSNAIAALTPVGNAAPKSTSSAITNSASGVISGAIAIEAFAGATLALLNQGLIISTSPYNFEAIVATGTITNAKTGTIIGGTGIDLDGGTIINAGLIESTNTQGAAILLEGIADNHITLETGSTLIGAISHFIAGDSIDEAGLTITSETFANGTLTLFDGSKTVAALQLAGNLNTRAFTLKSDGHGGTNIALGTETFAGTYTETVQLAALSNTIAATARITSPSTGLYGNFYRDWTLVNHGTITAGSLATGVELFAAAQITNTGIIAGANGIDFAGGTITDSGTITGTNAAIILDHVTGATAITLKSGAVLYGVIAGFETGDSIDLAAITATGESFANGILTLTNAGTVAETIAFAGLFNSGGFKLAAAAGGGTDITAAPTETFSGHYGTELTLSSPFTSITSTASLTGADGLYAPFGRAWTVVNAGTLSGSTDGAVISAGQLTNTAAGIITGVQDGAVADTGTLFNAGTITGTGAFSYGVDLYEASLTNLKSGTITGVYGGIEVFTATAANAGQISAPIGINMFGGTLTNTGRITGIGGGNIYRTYLDTALLVHSGAVTNAATGTLAGPTGVKISGGSLTNAGRILGLPGGYREGLYGGLESVASTGISITGGLVTNLAGGLISGAYGVALNGGTLTDAGTIASTLATGIAIAIGTVDSTLILDQGNSIHGAISGFIDGDILDFAATTITADKFANGILTLEDGTKIVETLSLTGFLTQKDFTLIPQGTLGTELIIGQEILSGAYTPGITLTAPTTITKTGIITAGTSTAFGNSAIYGSTARDWTLLNQGLLTGTLATYDDGVALKGAGAITNAATGTIIADFIGLLAGHYAAGTSLTNAGTILSVGAAVYASAVVIGGGSTVTNTGLIEGKTGLRIGGGYIGVGSTGLANDTIGGTITNAGTIATNIAGGTAIAFSGSGINELIEDSGAKLVGAIAGFLGNDVIDFASQTLTGETFANNTLALTNNGVTLQSLTFTGGLVASEFTLTSDKAGGTDLILGPEILTGTYQYGITLTANRTTIAATALVEVLAGHAAPGSSAYALVDLNSTGHTITNQGRVIDTYSGKSGAFIGADTFINTAGATLSGSAGIKIDGNGLATASLSNAGTIIGIRPGGYAAKIDFAILSNAKTGIISGDTGAFLYNAIATNAGTIAGASYAGIDVFGAYAAITNLAGGTITGPTGIAFLENGTVTNAGTIAGTAGTAIKFGSGASKFIEDPGATLIGGVTATGTAAHLLELATGSATGTLTGLGETILGFTTISFDAGAAFTLKGDTTGLAAGQTIESFSATDSIILDNFSATSFATIKTGLVLKNAGGTVTLDIATTSPGAFAIHAAGTATTITTSAAAAAHGAIITTGALATAPMQFLRPNFWAPALQASPLAATPPAPAATTPATPTAPTLTGWLTLDPAPRPAIPAVTLHAT